MSYFFWLQKWCCGEMLQPNPGGMHLSFSNRGGPTPSVACPVVNPSHQLATTLVSLGTLPTQSTLRQ
jgi:hypothetical protein